VPLVLANDTTMLNAPLVVMRQTCAMEPYKAPSSPLTKPDLGANSSVPANERSLVKTPFVLIRMRS